MNNDGKMSIAHAIKGRIRISAPRIKRDFERAIELEKKFQSLPGVKQAEMNLLAGSILVMYDPDEADLLLEAAEDVFPELAGQLQDHFNHMDEPRPKPAIAKDIAKTFRGLDKRVSNATGGVNLRVLVPITLFALGMKDLIFSGTKSRPSWYDFFWFSLGTFFMLNEDQTQQQSDKQERV